MMDYEIKAVITKGIHKVLSGIGSPYQTMLQQSPKDTWRFIMRQKKTSRYRRERGETQNRKNLQGSLNQRI